MKRGFTLIELLGVIVIISVLALITIPIIDSSLNKGKQNLSDIQKEQLIKSLRDYYSSNIDELSNITDKVCKTISELQEFLPNDIKDPKNNKDYNVKVCVEKKSVTCTSHLDDSCYNYSYTVEDN